MTDAETARRIYKLILGSEGGTPSREVIDIITAARADERAKVEKEFAAWLRRTFSDKDWLEAMIARGEHRSPPAGGTND